MQTAIPCTAMRGGTSKGLFFLIRDLPADTATRDAVLLVTLAPGAYTVQLAGVGGTTGVGIIEVFAQ